MIGYYCFGESAQVPTGNLHGVYNDQNYIDVGLGIEPSLCGQGLGLEFLRNGLEFAKENFLKNRSRLTVASFNNRAIKVYERIGFKPSNSFKRYMGSRETEFIVMICDFESSEYRS